MTAVLAASFGEGGVTRPPVSDRRLLMQLRRAVGTECARPLAVWAELSNACSAAGDFPGWHAMYVVLYILPVCTLPLTCGASSGRAAGWSRSQYGRCVQRVVTH